MTRREGKPIDRRRFLWSSAAAAAGAGLLGIHPSAVFAAASGQRTPVNATELMKAAAAGIAEFNEFFSKSAAEAERAKAMLERAKQTALVMTVIQVLTAVILIVVALVIAAVTFGAGAGLVVSAITARSRLDAALLDLAQAEADIVKANQMGPRIAAAIARVRKVVADVKDVVVARDIVFRLSQDRTYATEMLEALSAARRAVAEELLRRPVAGSAVAVHSASVAGPVSVTFRINDFNYCLSSVSACGGKALSFRR